MVLVILGLLERRCSTEGIFLQLCVQKQKTGLKYVIFVPQGEPGEAGPPGIVGEAGKKVSDVILMLF